MTNLAHLIGMVIVPAVLCSLILKVLASVADPHRKNANADPGKNLNAAADSCPY
jgi:hypothetical protein